MNVKDEYRFFCESVPDMPVFSMPWWLDVVCGKQEWDVVLVKRDDKIVASFPYYTWNEKGMQYILMPRFTQKMGIYIRYPEHQTTMARLSYEKEIMTEIITRLPCYDFFCVNFDYRYTNWLPFYWQGFSQTTNYTYIIEDISNVEEVYRNFDRSKKKNIKKAQEFIEVGFDLPCSDFYENHRMTLQKQGKKISYSYELFRDLYEAVYREDCGRVIHGCDQQGRLHAAHLVVWDKTSAYDLISTIDPDYRDSGASTLLVYKMIQELSDKVKIFDFEGSMMEGVENSFRKFGTVQKPYFQVFRRKSKRFIVLKGLKDIWNAIRD